MNVISTIAVIIGLGIAAAVLVRIIGGDVRLVDHWKMAWRYYSTWGMAFVAMLPDLWNGLLAGGYMTGDEVTGEISWAIKAAMIGTFILGQIKQVERPKAPDFGK